MNARALLLAVIGLGSTCASTSLVHAQTARPLLPVDSILAHFQRQTRARARTGDGVTLILNVFSRPPGGYSPRQDSLLNGLERLVDFSDNRDVREFAAQMLAAAGEEARAAPPLPGIVRRLERIYHRHGGNEDYGIRTSILPSLPLQRERGAAAALLRTIASQPDPGNNGTGVEGYFGVGDPRTGALAGLSEMGQEGRAVLQAMYRSGEAASPQARVTLEHMAQRGFPVTDLVERRRAADRQTIQP